MTNRRLIIPALFAIPILLNFIAAACAQIQTGAQGRTDHTHRPNILWITSEDNSAHWLGCYGNDEAETPRIDALASDGLLFQNAFSNAPVCAVARSTILTGCYAVTLGTQHMRSRYQIPARFRPYVTYLREHGYYCTNNSKTDYNIQGDDKSIWEESSGKAHYKNRPVDQPFFAIFNLNITHESSLFPDRVQKNRKQGKIPEQTRLNASRVIIPAHLPDLPEIRSDVAIYHDNITALDAKVGQLLDDLEKAGLAEDTIVFYYGDHGGPTPRSKRYLFDTGVRVPLLIRIPQKWKHLSAYARGSKVEEPVSFVDFAPTLLSLCGLDTPDQMQGRAFLGEYRTDVAENADVFLYADRFDEIVGMRRGITDGRFKYIRRFTPHLPAAPCANYSLSMPSWVAWQTAWQNEVLDGPFNAIWETPQPVELLFDTVVDPWEINNLADDPNHASRLVRMRNRLKGKMIASGDTGVIPECLFEALKKEGTIHDFVHSDSFDMQRAVDFAFLASSANPENLPVLIESAGDPNVVIRYWSALGCLILGEDSAAHFRRIRRFMVDAEPAIRIMGARALFATGRTEEAKLGLLAEFQNTQLDNGSAILLINAIKEINAENEVSEEWRRRVLDDDQANEYVKRFAKELNNAR